MARLAQQDDAALGETVEQFSESELVDFGQRFDRIGDHLRQCPSTRLAGNVVRGRASAILGPPLFSNQRHERDGAKVLFFEFGGALAR